MDILFLLTGFVFAILIPVLNINILGTKGFVYSFIIIIFAIVVLAYLVLSIFKFKISKIDYIKSSVIVSWNINFDKKKPSMLPYILSLFFGLLLGIFIYFQSFKVIESILFSLACAFTLLGWWLMGVRRLDLKLEEVHSFLLSHIGLIYNGNIDLFNGYSKGILNAKKINNFLILEVLKRKKTVEIKIEIPKENQNDVDAFLVDLKKYFSGENNEA